MNKPSESIKTIWSLRIFIRFFINSLIIFLVEYFFLEPNFKWPLIIGILPGSILLLGILRSLIIPHFRYKYWQFDVRDTEIYFEYGIFTRIKTLVPYSRIQHLDIQQTFFERMMHLSSLIIYTAGSSGADISIPGLPEEYAEALRDELKTITSEDEV